MDKPERTFAEMASDTAEVVLAQPIFRGETTIAALGLRRPDSGELRGLKLNELLNADVTSIITLLPRISVPTITAHEAAKLDLVSLRDIANEVVGFFLSDAEKAAMSPG